MGIRVPSKIRANPFNPFNLRSIGLNKEHKKKEGTKSYELRVMRYGLPFLQLSIQQAEGYSTAQHSTISPL